jgi:hypothetical protein
MSCNDKARTTPRTLKIVSLVKSRAGRCKVDARGSASHDVEITNVGGIPYSVDIHSECQTPCVRYQGTDGLPQASWDRYSLVVQSYPGSGTPRVRVAASQPLMSLGAARAQSIKTDVSWAVPGLPGAFGMESIGAQVDTL